MASFYGGKPGIPFVIKETFDNFEVMIQAFSRGKDYTTVGYGEYAMINNDDATDINRGRVFKRTYNEKGYEEVGSFAGPQGASMNFRGEYSNTDFYYLNKKQIDIVYYKGSSYIRIGEGSTKGIAPDTDDTKWAIIAQGGEAGGGSSDGIVEKELLFEDLNNIKDNKYTVYYASGDENIEGITQLFTIQNIPEGGRKVDPTSGMWDPTSGVPGGDIENIRFSSFILVNKYLDNSHYVQELSLPYGTTYSRYSTTSTVMEKSEIDYNGFDWGKNGAAILDNGIIDQGSKGSFSEYCCYSIKEDFYISTLYGRSYDSININGSSPETSFGKMATWKLNKENGHYIYENAQCFQNFDSINDVKIYYCSSSYVGRNLQIEPMEMHPYLYELLEENYADYERTKWSSWKTLYGTGGSTTGSVTGGGSYCECSEGPTGPTGPAGQSWITEIDPNGDGTYTLVVRTENSVSGPSGGPTA